VSLLLRVRVRPAGGWEVQLGRVGTSPAVGVVDNDACDAVVAQADGLRRVPPGLAIPGRDTRVSRSEEAFGRQLYGVLRLAGVDGRLARFLGGGGGVVLCDIDPGLHLPWELLADEQGVSIEGSGQAAIVRLLPAPGRPTRSPRSGSGARVWGGDADATAAGHARWLKERLEPGEGVLHVVIHGHRERGALLSLGAVGAAGSSVAHALGPQVRHARAVVLHVCEAAGADLEIDLLQATLASGAAAVCAPAGVASVAALQAFVGGLHDSLAAGQTLVQAVVAGRASVRGLASPRPDARWHRLVLGVASAEALEWTATPTDLAGWPPLSADAAHVVATALQAAGHGYLGLPALARALPPALLAPDVRAQMPAVPAFHVRQAEAEVVWSPRLRTLVDRLPSRPSLQLVAGRICAAMRERSGPLPGHDRSRGGTTLDIDLLGGDGRGASGLEVVTGPEDGRQLSPEVGDRIGRWSDRDGPEWALFENSPCWDPFVSRAHLEWLGDGWVVCRRPVRLDGGQVVRGQHRITVGQRVWLTPSTALRGT